ncbi:unnamed protein product [Leptosia nina]|uniref:DUF4781 domain-containing protein n=1 Tax=Leptosia nina TaxID=320188 RepID=A0AAV1IXT1_9NEOP
MDVDEANWVQKAHENIDKYLHRGGGSNGNEPQLLEGTNLQNTIGIAMGLPLLNPAVWSHDEIEQASRGELVFFDGKSLEAINVIVNGIRECCNGDGKMYVTVIPIELYYKNKLYEVPVFKVQRYHHSEIYYVDNIGRYYNSFGDWRDNNKLPPCKMVFPQNLELKSDGQGDAIVTPPYHTPADETSTKVLADVDIAAGVVGIGSAIALMVVSGPFAPFIAAAGIATAIWGTGRAVKELVDRGEHGQSIDPFTDSTARLLWLGIAASVAGFGAMGATMRLSAVAARGIQISTALKILTNVVNATSVALNSAAIINNTIYLIGHLKNMSIGEILLNVALIAFWTKGTFAFKRSSVIIKEVQDQAFTHISEELPPGSRSDFAELRSRVQTMLNIDEIELLQLFNSAAKSGISIRECAEFLINGMRYYDVIETLSPEQIETLSSLRNFVKDDIKILTGLERVSSTTGADREETFKLVLSMWETYSKSNRANVDDVHFIPGHLVIGHAPPIEITTIPKLSPPLMRFVGEHLSKIDTDAIHEWSITDLVKLQDRGLFTECPVTGIGRGFATVTLNDQLKISVRKLQTLSDEDCSTMLKMVSELRAENITASSKIPSNVIKFCVTKNRLRFEIQRKESVEWAAKSVARYENLLNIVKSDLLSHEQDRLYTFRTEASMNKADVVIKKSKYQPAYMDNMMAFVSEMEPRNVSEMVAYSEFVMSYVVETAAQIEKGIQEGTITYPTDGKKSDWIRFKAKETVFENTGPLREKLNEMFSLVDDNDMVGLVKVAKGMDDFNLAFVIRANRLRFGGRVSAAYHIYKHGTDPPSAYIDQANATIRSNTYTVSMGQEGDTRIIIFNDENGGNSVVLEKDGRGLLCSFRAGGRK